MNGLEPCPWCKARHQATHIFGGAWGVECLECGCIGPSGKDMKDAWAKWNARPMEANE